MIILNFSHPLTPAQQGEIARLAGQPVEKVINLPVQFDLQQLFGPQLVALMSGIDLSSTELQNDLILVNPPSLAGIAVLVLAELHGRMGYWPPVIRLRPVKDSLPPRYEVAEVLSLQAVSDHARYQRLSSFLGLGK